MARVYSDKKEKQRKLAAVAAKKSKPAPEEAAGLLERSELLYTNIPLTPEERKKLGKWIGDRITVGLNSKERKEAVERIRQNRESYEKGVARDDMPFQNAHDVRLKWGAGQVDSIAVRLARGLFGLDPIIRVNGRNARSLEKAPKLEKFLDYWHDEFWKLGDNGHAIQDDVVRDGHIVLFQPWRLEIERGKIHHVEKQKFSDPVYGSVRWVNVDSMDDMVKAIKDGLLPENDYRIEDEVIDVVKMNGPDLEVHPYEDYVTVPWAKPESKLPWEGIRQNYSYDTVQEMEEQGEVYPGTLEALAEYAGTLPSGQDFIERGEDAVASSTYSGPTAGDSILQFWLWYGDYKLPGQKHMERLEVLFHKETGEVAYARRYRYEHGESPIDHLRFYTLSWRFAGMGAMEMFDSIEQAVQNIINYELDDTYMKSSMQFKYRVNRWAPEDYPMRPFKGVGVKSMTDWEPTMLPDYRATDMGLMSQLVGFGERRVQIGPYQQGQESPNNSRPTARGIFLLLEQARQLFDKAVRDQLRVWKNVVRKEVALFQQFMPEYMAVEAVGEDGEPLFPMGLGRRNIIGRFSFEMSGNVEAVLQELDQQMNMSLYDLMKDNPFVGKSVTGMYYLTEDLINSFRKKRKLLPPLEEIQRKLNLKPTPRPMTPQQERVLIASLKARDYKDEEIQDILKKMAELHVDEPAAPPGGGQVPGGPAASGFLPEAPPPAPAPAGPPQVPNGVEDLL